MLTNVMKSFKGAKYLNTRDCPLEGSLLFGSTKWKLNLPPNTNCNSHRLNKMYYSIPHPNTRAKRACVEESLNSVEHVVVHTTYVLETAYLVFQLHIARLPPSFAKRCWGMQVNICTLCNAKVGIDKHEKPIPTYKGLKEGVTLHQQREYELWLCLDGIKCCVRGNKIKYIVSWTDL